MSIWATASTSHHQLPCCYFEVQFSWALGFGTPLIFTLIWSQLPATKQLQSAHQRTLVVCTSWSVLEWHIFANTLLAFRWGITDWARDGSIASSTYSDESFTRLLCILFACCNSLAPLIQASGSWTMSVCWLMSPDYNRLRERPSCWFSCQSLLVKDVIGMAAIFQFENSGNRSNHDKVVGESGSSMVFNGG